VLQLEIPEREMFDEATGEFIYFKKESLQLEHSLVSLSKWESNWQKPFFGKEKKTLEQTVDYIKCMTITQNVRRDAYVNLPDDIFEKVDEYINLPMTATWFTEDENSKKASREIITSEVIYYSMIALQIPMECQKWHLNRLMTLIRVCNIKSQPPKKQGRKEAMSKRAALNQARRSQNKTRG